MIVVECSIGIPVLVIFSDKLPVLSLKIYWTWLVLKLNIGTWPLLKVIPLDLTSFDSIMMDLVKFENELLIMTSFSSNNCFWTGMYIDGVA